MRETYTSLQTATQNLIANDTSAQTLTFLQNELNRAKTFVYSDMGDFITQRTQTAVSVAAQQYYHLPVDCKSVESMQFTIGSWNYILTSVDSQAIWDRLNASPAPTSAIPRRFFERKRDVGHWPIVQSSGYVITLVYQILDRDMQYADSTVGNVDVANNSQTVTGHSTAWDSTFVGRWFNGPDGFWYKITAVASATSLTLETSYEDVSASAQSYTIGDSPDLPEELIQLLPYRAAANYYAGFRKDFKAGEYWTNMFYTGDPKISATQIKEGEIEPPGGYLAVKAAYASRSTDYVIRRDQERAQSPIDSVWATTVTGF